MGLSWTGLSRGLAAGGVVCGTLAGGLLAFAPAGGAAAGRDLEVTSVQFESLPSPPYLILGRSGSTQRLTVRIVTRNAGSAAVGPSQGRLDIEDSSGDVVAHRDYKVEGLASGQAKDTILMGFLHPRLGFTRLVATADPAHKIADPNRDNNVVKSGRVPVAAREWDAKAMSVSGETPQGNFVDQVVRDEFYFRFWYFDGAQFRYRAIGEVKAIQNFGGVCTAHGEKTASHNPWPSGGLAIDYKLDAYQANVPASHEPPFRFPFRCGGRLIGQAAGTFVDLVTLKGGTTKQPMRPTATSLVGGSQQSRVRYSWLFRAHVP